MSPIILRRALLSSLVLLAACAVNPEGWEERASSMALPAIYKQSTAEEMFRRCEQPSIACAVRDWKAGICWILGPDETLPEWLMDHEMKHCRGFEHAAWHQPFRWLR